MAVSVLFSLFCDKIRFYLHRKATMKTLTISQFNQAKDFIEQSARPLDQSLFKYYFEQQSSEKVLENLSFFQNSDGGFGHALEPDFRLSMSSPLATSVAFQYLNAINANSKHPLIIGAIKYLENTFLEKFQGWKQVPPEVNKVPRAIWWNYDDEKANEYLQNHWANPSAEILSYLIKYSDPDRYDSLLKHAVKMLKKQNGKLESHDFLCFLRLAQQVPSAKEALIEELKKSLNYSIATSPDQWSGYGLRPYWVVNSPDSLFYCELEDIVSLNLDYEIENQQSDGSWIPFWSWMQYEKDWPEARQDWSGYLTVKLLKTLNNFNRIEGH